MKKIKCLECGHTWSSGAKSLTSRGVYCRNCSNKDYERLSWVSGYTDTSLEYTKTPKRDSDFLQHNQSAQELKDLEDLPKSITSTKEAKDKDTIKAIEEKNKKDLLVDKVEKVVTRTGKGQYRTRSLDDLMRTVLILGENFQNRRFEESGFNYRYGTDETAKIRDDMIQAFNEAYGVEIELTPQQELFLLATMYSTPSIYHEVRYKGLGVRMKSWYSKFKAQRIQKKAIKEEEKKKKKPLNKEEISEALEELEDLENGTISET